MNMIPKNIHYCWFGGKQMPELEKRCYKSWNKQLKGYEKFIWNESSFDIDSNLYVKQAYNEKKYAFVSDYVRLYALYNYGGIYLDTDMELLNNLDPLLCNKAFSGIEAPNYISTCLIGSVKHHPWIELLLSFYNDKSFYLSNGEMDLTTNVATITDITEKEYGFVRKNELQVLRDELIIYPSEYFCPKDWNTKKIILTKNTIGIHHFSSSWWH